MGQSDGELQRGDQLEMRPEDKGGVRKGRRCQGTKSKHCIFQEPEPPPARPVTNTGKGSGGREQGGGWGQDTQGLGWRGDGAGADVTMKGTGWEITGGV